MERSAAIGVDVGGTTTSAGLVDPDGAVLAHRSAPTHARGAGTALDTAFDLIAQVDAVARSRGIAVAGVGIGVPGTADVDAGVVGADIHHVPELASVPIAALVSQRFGVPAFVDNDANVLALGEWTWGAARGARSLVLLAIGTGVGAGIVLGGRVERGRAGFAGELGHVPIDFEGRPCICGGRGCLEMYVAGPDIAREGSRRLGRPVEAGEVFELAARGDSAVRPVVDRACEALAAGLAMIVNGLNPEAIVLAGSVAKSLVPLESDLRRRLARRAFARALDGTHIGILALDKDATVRGGAALLRCEVARRSAPP